MPWVAAEARKRRGPNGAAASVYVKELQAVDGQLLSVLQLYDDLIRVGYNQQAQQRVKDEHTVCFTDIAPEKSLLKESDSSVCWPPLA